MRKTEQIKTLRYVNNWRFKSLEILEGLDFGDPKDAPTNLVKRCTELTKVPLSDFSTEDLRRMISQQIGLFYLVPLAIEKLTENLFAEGLYEGDLLESVLKVEHQFWQANKHLWEEVDKLIADKKDTLSEEVLNLDKFYSFKM